MPSMGFLGNIGLCVYGGACIALFFPEPFGFSGVLGGFWSYLVSGVKLNN